MRTVPCCSRHLFVFFFRLFYDVFFSSSNYYCQYAGCLEIEPDWCWLCRHNNDFVNDSRQCESSAMCKQQQKNTIAIFNVHNGPNQTEGCLLISVGFVGIFLFTLKSSLPNSFVQHGESAILLIFSIVVICSRKWTINGFMSNVSKNRKNCHHTNATLASSKFIMTNKVHSHWQCLRSLYSIGFRRKQHAHFVLNETSRVKWRIYYWCILFCIPFNERFIVIDNDFFSLSPRVKIHEIYDTKLIENKWIANEVVGKR